MSRFGFERRSQLLDSTISSTYTSNALLSVEFASISLSVQTNTTAASLFTVQGSNGEGFNAAIPDGSWSNLTTLVAQGIYTIDPGVRWQRVLRSSLESLATVVYEGWAS